MELAEDALGSIYLSLLEAKRAGGDVSELVELLNTSLKYNSEAERALASREYEGGYSLLGRLLKPRRWSWR